jgi:hypothetical protein
MLSVGLRWDLVGVAIFGNLLPALFVLCFPFWQGRFLFGVRVAEDFAPSATARAIVWRFRWMCFVGAGASTALMASGVLLWAPLLNAIGLMGALQLARMQVRPFAAPAGGTLRRAVLSEGGGEETSAWWVWAGPVLGIGILACSMALLLGSYDSLPVRYPVHWNAAGVADRWAVKSLRSVLGPLFIGAATELMLGFVLYALQQSSPLGSKRGRLNQASLALLALALSVLLSLIGLSPMRGTGTLPQLAWLPIWLPLVLMAPVTVVMIWLQGSAVEEEEATRDEGWRGAWWFSDAADSRMMVPSRVNSGYTFNFGNRAVRVALPVMVGVMVLSVWIVAG